MHSVSKNLEDHKDKLDDKTKEEVQAALEAARGVDGNATVEVLKQKVSDLTNASMKIGQAIYAKGGNAADGSAGAQSQETNAKEAEYEEKKKN